MNNKTVLAKAVLNAAEQLGLEPSQIDQVLGVDHTAIINMGAATSVSSASSSI